MLKSARMKINAIVVPVCSAIVWFWPAYGLHVFLFICAWVMFGFWRINREMKRDEKALELEMQMVESEMAKHQ